MHFYQSVGLILFFIFYLAYFIKQLLLQKQGISVSRLTRGHKAKKTMIIEFALFFLTIALAAGQLIGLFLLPDHPVSSWLRGCGILIILIGTFLFLWAIIAMHDSWRAGIDRNQQTRLIETGPYRFCRNPAFLGFYLFYVGFAMLLNDPLLWLLSLITIVVFHLQVLEEEKHLTHTFGGSYLNYKMRVKRYGWF